MIKTLDRDEDLIKNITDFPYFVMLAFKAYIDDRKSAKITYSGD